MLLGLHINCVSCGAADAICPWSGSLTPQGCAGRLSSQLQTSAAGGKESPTPAQEGSGNSRMDGVVERQRGKMHGGEGSNGWHRGLFRTGHTWDTSDRHSSNISSPLQTHLAGGGAAPS